LANVATINSNNKLDPCKMQVKTTGGNSDASWINQTSGSLTLRSSTIANYFNDANGNSISSPLTIATGNPATGGGLKLTLKTGITPPITIGYTIGGVTCVKIQADDAPSIDIQT
jgi:hypothetical protein